MFTGIVEEMGEVVGLHRREGNLNLEIKAKMTSELKIDQSVAHNGICLTVVDIKNDIYTVTAIKETLQKTNLQHLKLHQRVNLERAMKLGDRLDGHMVQGHVDQTAKCIKIEEENGSKKITFQYDPELKNFTIEKGSVTVNGVSLTVVDSEKSSFSVAVIPYTYEHTNFRFLEPGMPVNLEFDLIGKYVKRLLDK